MAQIEHKREQKKLDTKGDKERRGKRGRHHIVTSTRLCAHIDYLVIAQLVERWTVARDEPSHHSYPSVTGSTPVREIHFDRFYIAVVLC
jgi:hypothetical protein